MKIGIDIGGSHIAVAKISENGKKLEEKRSVYLNDEIKSNIDDMNTYILGIINRSIEYYMDKYESEPEIIGIGAPGEIKDGVIYNAKNLKIEKLEIKDYLKNKYGCKVIVRNDAIVASIMESNHGNLKSKNALFITVGTGIGSVVISDGKIFTPNGNNSPEIGHMTIKAGGLKCSCGKKGCFEAYASNKKLLEMLNDKLKTNEVRTIDVIENYELVAYEDALDKYVSKLCIGIGNLIELFKPERIVFGGGFSKLGDTIVFEKIEKEIKEMKLYTEIERPKVFPAKFKNDAGILGSIII